VRTPSRPVGDDRCPHVAEQRRPPPALARLWRERDDRVAVGAGGVDGGVGTDDPVVGLSGVAAAAVRHRRVPSRP
jgi:hypothetical protein